MTNEKLILKALAYLVEQSMEREELGTDKRRLGWSIADRLDSAVRLIEAGEINPEDD